MVIIIAVSAFGFLYFVTKFDERVQTFNNDSPNLTGISYNTETFNATNQTIHGLATIMPDFIWVAFLFLAVAFITLLVVGLKKH